MSNHPDQPQGSERTRKYLRKIIKRAAYPLFRILALPFILFVRIGDVFRIDFYSAAASTLSLLPGLSGSYIRAAFYRSVLTDAGADLHIGFGTFFSKRGAKVGNKVNIGAYCIIGNVDIGNHVFIASRVSILSGKHQHTKAILTHDERMEPQFERIKIGDWTWIGEGAIVMADIGNDCIVGSGALISRPIPHGKLVAANPPKVLEIRHFSQDHRKTET